MCFLSFSGNKRLFSKPKYWTQIDLGFDCAECAISKNPLYSIWHKTTPCISILFTFYTYLAIVLLDHAHFLMDLVWLHGLHHENGHLGLVCVLWLDNIYFHMNVQSMLGRTGLSRFHFMLDIVLRHNTIRVENGLSDNRTCLPSKCLWGCAQLCYLYATLDFFS